MDLLEFETGLSRHTVVRVRREQPVHARSLRLLKDVVRRAPSRKWQDNSPFYDLMREVGVYLRQNVPPRLKLIIVVGRARHNSSHLFATQAEGLTAYEFLNLSGQHSALSRHTIVRARRGQSVHPPSLRLLKDVGRRVPPQK